MNKVQKIDYVKKVSNHLEEKNVFEIFEKLTRELIVHQPKNPIDFLIDRLKNPSGKRIFISGPPGSNVRELTLQLSDHFETDVISVGDLLKKEVSKKTEVGEKIDEYIKNMLYVPDEIVFKILKAHLDGISREKNIIVEGYPKTPYQSMALVRNGVIPDLFIVVNYSEEGCQKFVRSKFSENGDDAWNELSETDRSSRSLEYLAQYEMHIRDLKNHYKNNLIQADGESSTILNDLASLIRFKIKSTSARTTKILLTGAPGSGRTSVMNQIHKKLGLVPVSVSQLLMGQVERKTEVGKEVADSLKLGKMVSDEIIFGLLKNRLERADCRLNGYVLEGFPKNENQLRMMDSLELKLKPFHYFILKCDEKTSLGRLKRRFLDPSTMTKYTEEEKNGLDEKIQNRLTMIPLQSENVLKERLKRWNDFSDNFERKSGLKCTELDASLELEKIVETITFRLENQI